MAETPETAVGNLAIALGMWMGVHHLSDQQIECYVESVVVLAKAANVVGALQAFDLEQTRAIVDRLTTPEPQPQLKAMVTWQQPTMRTITEAVLVIEHSMVPSFVAGIQDCFHCGWPLDGNHVVAARLQAAGLGYFHQDCWEKIIMPDN